MPIDLEMLMSGSSHNVFPYFPFGDSSYADGVYDRALSFPPRYCVPRSPGKHQEFLRRKSLQNIFVSSVSYNKTKVIAISSEDVSHGVRKKKVSFADDRGLNLVEVREIPEAPKWAEDVITLLIGNTKRSVVKEKRWKIAFDNPPSPDQKLVEKLEKNMVALEYVSVEEGSDDILHGTVKVKNLAYEKKLYLRVTYDRWLSYVDIPCTYNTVHEKGKQPNEYDTFCFNTKILSVASRYEVIEFSICFQCDGKDYWDNNGGINYRLNVEYTKSSASDSHQTNVSKLRKKSTHQYS